MTGFRVVSRHCRPRFIDHSIWKSSIVYHNVLFNRKIKIDKQGHWVQPWKVHSLLTDFRVEDVWRVPVVLEADHSLQLFIERFYETNDQLVKNGLVWALFRFRHILGKIFKWDEKIKVDQLAPGSIRERYAREEHLSFEDLPHPGSQHFIPVYQLQNEFLAEIENKTVHAAVHLGRVPSENGQYGIQMAVYVKPKGLLGKLYMQLIKPFRHWIVYPALMKEAKARWERYLNNQ